MNLGLLFQALGGGTRERPDQGLDQPGAVPGIHNAHCWKDGSTITRVRLLLKSRKVRWLTAKTQCHKVLMQGGDEVGGLESKAWGSSAPRALSI